MDQGGGEFYQFYWYDLDKGTATLLTSGGETRQEYFLWANSGTRAVFSSTKRNGKDFDLYVMEGVNASSVRVLKQTEGKWGAIDWSPDDSQFLVIHSVSINESYLYVADPKTGDMKEINPTGGTKKIYYGDARFARDRKGIYYTSDEDNEFLRLTYHDLATGKKDIVSSLSWDVKTVDVSNDGKWIAYGANEGGISKLYLARTSNITKPQQLDLPVGVITSLKFDWLSTRLGFNLSSAQTPSDVFSIDLKSKKIARWTFSEIGGLNAEKFVSPKLIQYPTFDSVDGKPRLIPAFYYRPSGDSKKPFPVIINIHGGPESQAVATFNSTFQYWINELGAAVLVPNVRGSTGYGKSYAMLDNGMRREDSVKDIGKLLDWIASQPELDAKRVAVYGGSYGGYMVLSSLFHFPDRIKCGVDSVGISNFVTFLESTEDYRRDLRRPEYGDERDPKMREFLIKISPTTNAAKIRSALLVVQGKNDPRVPITESEQMVKVIRKQGGKVWYLMAKDEGHGFAKRTNRDFLLNTVSLFLEENLLK